MSLRSKIVEYLESIEDKKENASLITNNILNIIDAAGLELDEFREDTNIEVCCEAPVEKYLNTEATSDCLAFAFLFIIEDFGLSLSGNGWLDDDDLAMKIIDQIYNAENGEIESTDHQGAYELVK